MEKDKLDISGIKRQKVKDRLFYINKRIFYVSERKTLPDSKKSTNHFKVCKVSVFTGCKEVLPLKHC
jgi:hypothetical protein